MKPTKKGQGLFRDYQSASSLVVKTYKEMHTHQTQKHVEAMKAKYAHGYTDRNGNKLRMSLESVFPELDTIIDESDPDTDWPQIYHAFQTGEALKSFCDKTHPEKLKKMRVKDLFSPEEWESLPKKRQQQFDTDFHLLFPEIKDWSWLPLIGFIHDLGKVLAAEKWGALPQWTVVGDTFPVGTLFSKSNVYAECRFFEKNPDLYSRDLKKNPLGHYEKNCGFDSVNMSFGHDEYCYSVLSQTAHLLPEQALYIIRFHSFYAWHSPRNQIRGYTELASESDWKNLPLLKLFQRCDLYSKKEEIPNPKQFKEDYFALTNKFIPGRYQERYDLRPAKLRW